MFLLIGFCTILFLNGCDISSKEKVNDDIKDDDVNYSIYEFHLYDETFEHTEEVVAKYDENGKLKKFEFYQVYPEITATSACKYRDPKYADAEDLNYAGVEYKCSSDGNGMKLYFAMTDESIIDGYLELENSDFDLIDSYEFYDTEDHAKNTIQNEIDYLKSEGIKPSDKNYIIMDGKRIDW